MQNEVNPYQREVTNGIPLDPPRKLTGFFRGARNGLLWSLPVFIVLTIFIATYGRNPPPVYAAMVEAAQIPVIWMLIAGIVSAVADRRKMY